MKEQLQVIWEGGVKVCSDWAALEQLTSEGWIIVDQFDEHHVENEVDTVARGFELHESHSDRWNDNGTVQVNKSHTTSSRRWLLGLPRDESIIRLNKNIDGLNEKLRLFENLNKDALLKSKSDSSKIAELEKSLEQSKKDCEKTQTNFVDQRTLRYKLEDHISKAKKAIGDLKWKEIVGAEE